MNWIQECVMNLNVEDELISQHSVRILGLVCKRIEEFIQSLSDTASGVGGAEAGGVDAKTVISLLRTAKVLNMIIKGSIGGGNNVVVAM